ncbi:MAG TPA: hypothetical protein VG755_37800, partial [Nannocystaceae bacterium]|nr:hypothetical protein [Nannocystaceae bacterium]
EENRVMTRRDHALRFAVGSMLLALGCTPKSGETKPPTGGDGVCEPPDCHINPGPNDVPPSPQPEPPQPEPATPG